MLLTTFLVIGLSQLITVIVTAQTESIVELVKAIEKKDLESVRSGLANGVDPNLRVPGSELHYTPLFISIQAGDPTITKALLEAGANPMLEDGNGDPAMVHAAHADKMEHARLLIAHGTSIDSRNRRGITALMRGAPYEEEKDVKAKIELGANPDLTDSDGNTALIIAAGSANGAAMRALINGGAGIDFRNKKGESALLIVATGVVDVQAAELLIKGGADINLRTPSGDSALMVALRSWQATPDVIQLLLAAAPDVKFRNEDGCDALYLAVSNGKRNRHIERILELGGDLKTTSSDGVDLLMLAAFNSDLERLKDLIKRGLLPTRTDEFGRSAVHCAFHLKPKVADPIDPKKPEPAVDPTLEIIKLLHDNGASLTAANRGGDTPLHLAAAAGNRAAIEYLLPHFPQPDLPNALGETPLHLAAVAGSVEAMEVLLEKGLKIESRDHQGQMPLRLAIASGNQDAFLRLLKAGADINAVATDGSTALSSAVAADRVDHLRFLLGQGAKPESILNPEKEFLRAVRRFHDKPTLPEDDAFLIGLLAGLVSDVNLRDADGVTALMWVAASNNQAALSAILKRNPDLNARASDGRTAMIWAACSQAADSMRTLREAGADGSLIDASDRTAAGWLAWTHADHPDAGLIIPAESKRPAERIFDSRKTVLAAYIGRGVWNDEDRIAGSSPLHLAAALGDTDAIQALVQKGAKPDLPLEDRTTPLMEAAANGRLKAVELLVEKGANQKLRDSEGWRAIDHAVRLRHPEVVRMLLHGKEIMTDDETPFLVGIIRLGDPSLLRESLAAGAAIPSIERRKKGRDPFAEKSMDPGTALIAAARREKSDMLRLLFEYPAASGADDPDLTVSALHHAADSGSIANVKFLIENHQVDPNALMEDSFGGVVRFSSVDPEEKGPKPLDQYSALSRALEEGHEEIVRYLIDHGAIVTGRTRNGSPPLTFAVLHHRDEMLKLFLASKAAAETVDADGRTALHHAAAADDETVVTLLLEHGADPNATDRHGHTPLDLARREKAKAATKLLEKLSK